MAGMVRVQQSVTRWKKSGESHTGAYGVRLNMNAGVGVLLCSEDGGKIQGTRTLLALGQHFQKRAIWHRFISSGPQIKKKLH